MVLREQGQEVLYVTERAVFRLDSKGLPVLTKVEEGKLALSDEAGKYVPDKSSYR